MIRKELHKRFGDVKNIHIERDQVKFDTFREKFSIKSKPSKRVTLSIPLYELTDNN